MSEKRSIHMEMSITRERAGMDWRPEAWGYSASIEISDISMNSMSRILFTSFDSREAAGLYGLGPARGLIGTATGEESCGGDVAAAAARSSRPYAEWKRV